MARRKKLSPDPFEIEIDALLENGRGAGIHGEKTLQVHGALPGEKVSAKYLFGRRMKGQAETLEVLKASPDRIEPQCPHFGLCSACTLQHLDADQQLTFKQRNMLSQLEKLGGVQPDSIIDPLSAGRWHYRRKARMSVRYVRAKERVLVGFRERDGRFVADMSECHTLVPKVAEQLPRLSAMIQAMDAVETIPKSKSPVGTKAVH